MRYVIGFLISVGLIILVLVMIFRGGGDPAPAPNASKRMVDYANTSTVVQFIDDYKVSHDSTHRQIVTTVGRDAVTLVVETGYEGTILRSQTYPNNPTAYANFLRALQVAGYTNGDNSAGLRDERGYCPSGRRFVFEIKDGARSIQRYWSTSCGNIGSFKGRSDTVRSLFQRQVPDYSKLTSGVQLF
mgnify:CR=1 FL=1